MVRHPLLMVAATSTALADPAPRKLEARYLDGTNVHIANQGGAINRHTDVAIVVELRADGTLVATSTGTHRHGNLYPGPSSRSTEDTTKWRTAWSGRWSESAAALTLDLARATASCARGETTREFDAANRRWVVYQPTVRPCRTGAAKVRLTCTSLAVAVDDPAATIPAWRCSPATATELGETPSPWVLGTTACIESGVRRCRP
jgi:hypothetical protein